LRFQVQNAKDAVSRLSEVQQLQQRRPIEVMT